VFGGTAAAGVIHGLSSTALENAFGINGSQASGSLQFLSNGAWNKRLHPGLAAQAALIATALARNGFNGTKQPFEGYQNFFYAFTEDPWPERATAALGEEHRILETGFKLYPSCGRNHTAIDAALELVHDHDIDPGAIESIEVEIFDVAYHIIGGGEEGDKTIVRSKEEADHSLQYILAVALLDGQVLPDQYEPERIGRDDVQSLLRRIGVTPKAEYSERFPEQMPCRITVRLHGGGSHTVEKSDYEGFLTRPASFAMVLDKFDRLASPHVDQQRRQRITEAVDQLEQLQVGEFMGLLGQGRA
jgi:2-methylcitrate dehydratase